MLPLERASYDAPVARIVIKQDGTRLSILDATHHSATLADCSVSGKAVSIAVIAIIPIAWIVTTLPVAAMPPVMFAIELVVCIVMLVAQMSMKLRMFPWRHPMFMRFGMLLLELIMDVAMLSIEFIMLMIVARIAIAIRITIIAAT